MREIREILADLDVEVLSMKEAGVFVYVEENGKSYEENALLKARAVAKRTDAIVLADDSGLEIDALGGEPGIYSSRYLGEDTPYSEKNVTILKRMEGVSGEQRSARFVCAIAAIFPDGEEVTMRAVIEGEIAKEPAGEGGFGYDPIFYFPEFGKTTAQMTAEEKNQVSHRGKALEKMKEVLQNR